MQPVAVASLHSAHVASQASHAAPTPALPLGHAETHAPSSKKGVPASGHAVHAVAPVPEHSAHDTWQVAHVATSVSSVAVATATKVPLAHSATHVPLETKGASAEVHERQSAAPGPLHVPHASSHATHVPLPACAYLPSDVQSATQLAAAASASASRNGCDEAHVSHAVGSGPLQVAHVASQPTHASEALLEPPEHVKPSSMERQSAAQPSSATLLPSSQTSSPPTRSPSPQTVVHASADVNEPPAHA